MNLLGASQASVSPESGLSVSGVVDMGVVDSLPLGIEDAGAEVDGFDFELLDNRRCAALEVEKSKTTGKEPVDDGDVVTIGHVRFSIVVVSMCELDHQHVGVKEKEGKGEKLGWHRLTNSSVVRAPLAVARPD